jgi:hypothetical protein
VAKVRNPNEWIEKEKETDIKIRKISEQGGWHFGAGYSPSN